MSDEESVHRHYSEMDAGPEWGTPEWVWRPLADALGGFDLDPASGAEETPIAETRIQLPPRPRMADSVRDYGDEGRVIYGDGLEREWFGDVWLNPPYGRQHNPRWAQKVSDELSNVRTLTALIPASTSTQWFHEHYADAKLLTFIDERISFDGSGDNSASFASVIATWGPVTYEYVQTLDELGDVRSKTRLSPPWTQYHTERGAETVQGVVTGE